LGGGAEGIGSLQGMAPLNPAVALTAPADVDVELAVNGLARDLDLELLGDVGFVEGATAVRVGSRVGRRLPCHRGRMRNSARIRTYFPTSL
jgi:hypothetical protein